MHYTHLYIQRVKRNEGREFELVLIYGLKMKMYYSHGIVLCFIFPFRNDIKR